MPAPAARGPRRSVARVPHAAVPAARRPAEDVPPTSAADVTPRERAILMAIAAGRCTMSPDRGDGLLVDARPCADQFAGLRILRVGLARLVVQPPGRPCTVELTPAGVALLGLPITL